MRLKFKFPFFVSLLAFVFSAGFAPFSTRAASDDLSWPPISRTQKPWAYWWWMGNAVDKTNITKELTRYHDAGMGGVHIIPIYGAKGWETNYIQYLSPKWMDMLRFTVTEADRLDLGVDMTTGSGWCFGGPEVTDDEANASVVVKQFEIAAGEKWNETFDAKKIQALMAFGPNGKKTDLLPLLQSNGAVNWTSENGPWHVFAISQKPSGQKVKRAGPGGQGWMLNLFYPKAMTNYLRWFDNAFANYSGPKPRAQYHDSYEYRSDWSPDFFAQFEKRRGYRLQDELPALFGKEQNEKIARVKCDYRETISELMSEVTLPLWVNWSHQHGFITRDEAHGSPGNLLDLYAAADIPETEMFHTDRNKLISKFSSSAAHVAGHPLSSSETGTWLKEHFTGTLADMKFLEDDLFLSGVNHIFYHGTCYSPDEAPWPGWAFYASFDMNPRNSIWRDVPELNAYVARCQSVLQSGRPDNDILVYWPIYDFWSDPKGMVQPLTVHARDWFENQPIGKAAEWLWNKGFQFDYISDHQLAGAKFGEGRISVRGGTYRVIVVPKCDYMPLQTLSKLVALVKSGATVIFQDELPKDVPGLADLKNRRTEFKKLITEAQAWTHPTRPHAGRVVIGDLEQCLSFARVPREAMFDQTGLMCIRRKVADGEYYFIANRGEKRIDGWIPIASETRSAVLMNPLNGQTGVAASRVTGTDSAEIYLQLDPGESVIARILAHRTAQGPKWNDWKTDGNSIELKGTWSVKFVKGGPELPASFSTEQLASWTKLGDTNAQRFAGSAVYTLKFDAPAKTSDHYRLDLGKVCQSARVRLNGRDLGTLITPPFRIEVKNLKPKENVLEVEVTNVSANRIRDLDRRGVNWKYFHDINFVDINYHRFDASNWPLTDSGLLGPVTLTPLAAAQIE
ncbi:MAG TPA: glycosyl hydrolase [Verrucomicrobiae bacterium]|nr:glycosyl hydrolase [Verrucomicrobiae bacterium]